MSQQKNSFGKKALILLVLEVLKKYSDKNHPLLYKDIIDKVYGDYGAKIDRGTVENYIAIYQELGYAVVHLSRKGYYLEQSLIEQGELPHLEENAVIMYVLDVLKKYSDEEHPLTLAQISEKLESEYGIPKKKDSATCISKKALNSYVKVYNDLGYAVKRIPHQGYYAVGLFADGEATLLIDSVLSIKSLHPRTAKTLTNKIRSTLPQNKQAVYDYASRIADSTLCGRNEDVITNVELLCKAITDNKQVEFHYKKITGAKDMKLANDGKPYRASPYSLWFNKGNYYLLCKVDSRPNMHTFRVDKIYFLQILEQDATPDTQVREYTVTGLDDADYINHHPYFTNSCQNWATIRVEDGVVDTVYDWFGKGVVNDPKPRGKFWDITVKADNDSFKYWALQYAEKIEIVSEQERNNIINTIKTLAKKYKVKLDD